MNCQECGKRPASLHFTKIVNGEKAEFHLCETCAKEKGELIPGTPNGFSIHNLLSGLMNFDPSTSSMAKQAQSLRCEECGLTYSQFSKLGRFGCSSCYKYFGDKLDSLLKRVHGNTTHVGKVPKRSGGIIKYKREIDQLKLELARKIEQEEFEQAAKIRDEIRGMEKRITEI
ncbi:protein-arginine kinase activator protein [Paenibacillus sp. J31TS4]|uniref:UvrB/UvrC motif-containing protein n=1 Tax=Paenibacillus sp. J31TS4 TaxID=2807195 RepID=UPI001B1ABD41|nr:UvrB/UvrC motif-containing protein [Paenibacillus sp. J31TS4]GIP41531.1 protein-arginine kinase activator protein [Paenibacillus sp. J31TS4]